MESSKLYHYLSLLNPKEYKPFRRFLQSPYHNRQPILLYLFNHLVGHLFRDKPKPLTEEGAALLLFPDDPYDRNRFRKLCTALLQCICEFIKVEGLREEAARGEVYLLRRLNAAKADRFLPGRIEIARKILQEVDQPIEYTSDLSVELGLEFYKYEMRQPNRSPESDPGALIRQLDDAFALRRIRLIVSQLNHHKITGKGEEPGDDFFLKHLAEKVDRYPPVVAMYYYLYLCNAYPQRTRAFEKLRSLLQAQWHGLYPDDLENLYQATLNHSARLINRGIPGAREEMFSLYQEVFDRGMLGQDGSLLKAHFKNLMVLSCNLGEFDWAGKFLEDHASSIIGNHHENGLHFGRGVIAFFKDQPEEAARYFYRVLQDYEDIFFGIDARGYLLKIHYETGNTMSLESLCDSYRMFLKRNKELPGSRKANYNFFVNCMRRLARIPEFDKARLERLKRDILEGRKISNTVWLLEKVDEALAKE